MNETKTEWRDCADPDELAAAVAAGVEVRAMGRAGDFPTANQTADRFAGSLRAGITYRIPASWTWRPEPTPEPDDLRERIARAAAGGYMRVPIVARDGMYLGPPWLDVADAVLAVLPTPPPAPPWPGAVLSGLTDEDGVPTWLAQAGNVQGESVRTCADFPWFVCGSDNASDRTWVEVRAPRAVPEPETERVPWWDAVGDERLIDWMGDPGKASPAKSVGPWNDCPLTLWSGDKCSGMLAPVAPDGTVEVLRDGGQ